MSGITADEARAMAKKAQQDLIEEERELNIKIVSLVQSNNHPSFESMDCEAKDLFKRQEKAMIEYSLALRERIEA